MMARALQAVQMARAAQVVPTAPVPAVVAVRAALGLVVASSVPRRRSPAPARDERMAPPAAALRIDQSREMPARKLSRLEACACSSAACAPEPIPAWARFEVRLEQVEQVAPMPQTASALDEQSSRWTRSSACAQIICWRSGPACLLEVEHTRSPQISKHLTV